MSLLQSDLPVGQTLEMPCNNLLRTDFHTIAESSLAASDSVSALYFVDHIRGGFITDNDGSLSKPFADIPTAIAAAVTAGLVIVQLQLAAGTYSEAVAVPEGLSVSFCAWDFSDQNQVVLGGDITATAAVGQANLAFFNVFVTAANITTAVPASQDMVCLFEGCFEAANISGRNLTLQFHQTTLAGAVSADGSCTIIWDGHSWSYWLQLATSLPPGAVFYFRDAGHDTYATSVTVNGVTVGSVAFVPVALPTLVGQGDRVDIQVTDPAVQDFICGIHGVGTAGTVTVWLRNLSRVSQNFNEACLFLIHHELMVAEPAP
jgi:hypothetical protein